MTFFLNFLFDSLLISVGQLLLERCIFFCGVGFMLKPSFFSDYVVSCPVWSSFFPHWAWVPESKYLKLPSDFKTWKAPRGDIAPASSYLYRKVSACMALALENQLLRREAAELLFEDFSGFRWGKAKKGKSIVIPNILMEHCKLTDSDES